MRTLRAQLHVKAFFELKDGAHELFEVCRSLGLAGTLRQEKHEAVAVPFGARAKLGVLRFNAAFLAVLMACWYPIQILHFNQLSEFWDEPQWFSVLFSFSAAIPYSIVGFLITSDMIESLHCVELCVALAASGAILVLCTAAAGYLIVALSCFFVYLLHVAAAFASAKFCAQRATKPSRVGLLCEFHDACVSFA